GAPAPEPTGRSLPEPAARSVPEPAAGPAPTPPPGPVAALPAVPAQRRAPEAPNAPALPAPAIGPRRPSPAGSKESNRRKLAAAREVLARHAVRLPEAVAAIEPGPEAAVPSGAPGTGSPVGTESFTAGTPTSTDSLPPAGAGGRAAQAVAFARAQIGRPCVWGATGPGSYDYAGLTQAAWKAAGVSLPRSAQGQVLAGTPVALTGIRDGDLVFFFDNDSHVGLYVGDGMMVHAPGPGSAVREESIYGAGESAIHRVIRPA
ncbi:C40 family peptidase, partial [Streptomyces sp. NPDC001508]|uniref:C40 family peptidase n=1 Tax=Streptomyces sp. NPDC001508 TaxID=3154656 RepID=UPI00331B04FB